MLLQNYFQDPSVLHIGTEPLRAYYVPCKDEMEAAKADMLTTSRARTLNGADWKFKFYESYHQIPASAVEKDAATGDYDTIPVPSCWQILGYDHNQYTNIRFPIPFDPPYVPDENPAGVYVKEFSLTAEEAAQKIYLNFDGVDSCYYVWVNGIFTGYSQISHSGSEFDISDKVVAGTNRLTVLVLKWCDGSYLEDQDKLRFTGIFRDVYLLIRPQDHIRDYFVHTPVSEDLHTASIDVEFSLCGSPDVQAKLLCPNGQVLDTAAVCDGKLHFTVSDPDLWNAEHPALYTLLLSTSSEVIAQKVGIRRIDVKGNVIYFNGATFKLKGTNRHDSNPYTGAAVTREQLLTDLKLMKEHNINAIRTSHYPNAPWATQMYDQYGFYVMDEADLESHGSQTLYGTSNRWTDNGVTQYELTYGYFMREPSYEAAVIDRIQHLVHRDKNCASVFSWSMGNESGYGPNMEKAVAWAKSYDPDRILSYESSCLQLMDSDYENDTSNLDVYSRMYSPAEFIDMFCEQEGNKPFIQVEYAHAMGNGPGDLEAYFERLYKHPGYIGGFVWEWCDHSVYMGKTIDGRDQYYYGGDWNEEVHDGNFCMDGLVYPDRTPHVGLLEHKNVARPIRAALLDSAGTIRLDNKLDFTNLKDHFTIQYEIIEDGTVLSSDTLELPDCPPHTSVEITLTLPAQIKGNTTLTLHYLQKGEAMLTPSGFEAGQDQFILSKDVASAKQAVAPCTHALCSEAPDSSAPLFVEDLENQLIVTGSSFRYVFDKWKGTFSHLTKDQKTVTSRPIELNIWRAPIDNDRRIRDKWRAAGYDRARTKVYRTTWNLEDGSLSITSDFSLAAVSLQKILEGTISWTITSNGSITVAVTAKRQPLALAHTTTSMQPMPYLPRFGLRLFLDPAFDQISYFGYGPQESYIDKHRSSHFGLFSSSLDGLWEDYLRPQENGSHYGCNALSLSSADHRSLIVSADAFSFNASRYTQEELTVKDHNFEIEPSPYTVLCLDGYMSGCGSSSCGPDLAEQYQVNDTELAFTFTLEF